LPPLEALRCAYLQGRSNYSTWDYDKVDVPVTVGRYTLGAGDYSVWQNIVEARGYDPARGSGG